MLFMLASSSVLFVFQKTISIEDSMIKKFLLLLTFASSLSADTVTLQKNEFNASNKLGDIGLIHRDKTFFVIKDDEEIEVQNAFVEKSVRNLPTEHVEKFLGRHIALVHFKGDITNFDSEAIEITKEEAESLLARGYFVVGQTTDGDYTIKSQVRVLGGGPLFGFLAYWITKTICYGTAAAGAGAAIVATGGIAGPISGALIAGGANAGLGVTMVAGGIGAAAGGTAAAATATGVTIGAAGGVAGAIAAVESASMGVATFFTWLPIP